MRFQVWVIQESKVASTLQPNSMSQKDGSSSQRMFTITSPLVGISQGCCGSAEKKMGWHPGISAAGGLSNIWFMFRWYSRDGRYLPTRTWIFIQDIQEQWAEDHPDMNLECTCDLDLDDGGAHGVCHHKQSTLEEIHGTGVHLAVSPQVTCGGLFWVYFLQRPDQSNTTSRRFFETCI